jgi:hypothetical protein
VRVTSTHYLTLTLFKAKPIFATSNIDPDDPSRGFYVRGINSERNEKPLLAQAGRGISFFDTAESPPRSNKKTKEYRTPLRAQFSIQAGLPSRGVDERDTLTADRLHFSAY